MLMNQTFDKLDALGLFGMALGLREQLESSQYLSLSFDERLGLLVDREAEARDSRRLALRLKAAKLRQEATVEDIDFRTPRREGAADQARGGIGCEPVSPRYWESCWNDRRTERLVEVFHDPYTHGRTQVSPADGCHHRRDSGPARVMWPLASGVLNEEQTPRTEALQSR